MTQLPDPGYMTVRGKSIGIYPATQFIHRLSYHRDSGGPTVFQDTNEALNREATDHAGIQEILDEAIDVLIMWLESKRRCPVEEPHECRGRDG